MGSRQSRVALACSARGIGGDGFGPELAHPPGRVNSGNAIQLGIGASGRRTYFPKRKTQQAGSRHGTNSAARHDRHDLALLRVQVGHQVGGTGEPVP
jgi:hypothetical protein